MKSIQFTLKWPLQWVFLGFPNNLGHGTTLQGRNLWLWADTCIVSLTIWKHLRRVGKGVNLQIWKVWESCWAQYFVDVKKKWGRLVYKSILLCCNPTHTESKDYYKHKRTGIMNLNQWSKIHYFKCSSTCSYKLQIHIALGCVLLFHEV